MKGFNEKGPSKSGHMWGLEKALYLQSINGIAI